MAAPTILIEPPVRAPRVGGIGSVATFRPNSRLGVTGNAVFISDGCTFPQISEHLCYVGEDDPADKEFEGVVIDDAIGAPFPLYGAVGCFIGPDEDYEARARAVLELGRDRALEEQLGTWAAGGTALAAGADVKLAIGRVEQALDDDYIGRGVILMSRFDTAGADLEHREGSYPVTVNGTPVIASGRIAPGTVYGLGAITVEQSAMVERRTYDLPNNKSYALAEQVFVIAVDCEFRVKSAITPA